MFFFLSLKRMHFYFQADIKSSFAKKKLKKHFLKKMQASVHNMHTHTHTQTHIKFFFEKLNDLSYFLLYYHLSVTNKNKNKNKNIKIGLKLIT